MKDLTKEQCLTLLKENYIGRLGYMAKGSPEIIPITYFYDSKMNSILTYSGVGGKIEAMRKSTSVAFQIDEITSLDNWKSVLILGEYEELTGIDAKHLLHVFSEGVKKVILEKENRSTEFIGDFSSKLDTDGYPIVYRINISEIKGKQKK